VERARDDVDGVVRGSAVLRSAGSLRSSYAVVVSLPMKRRMPVALRPDLRELAE